MNKCDFCPKLKPNGQCYWNYQEFREEDCKKAIKLMAKALKGSYKYGRLINWEYGK